MFDWVVNLVRDLFWSIAYASMWLMDRAYETSLMAISMDFTKVDNIWKIWASVAFFVGMLICMRVVSKGIKLYIERNEEMFDILSFFTRLMIISAIVVGFPLVITTANTVGRLLSENAHILAGISSDTLPSTILLSAYVSEESGTDLIYTLDQISINEKVDGKYKFLPEYWNIMIITLMGAGSAIILIAIALSIAKRLFEHIQLIIVAPIPLSSYIFKEGNVMSVWSKSFVSIYLCNFLQITMMLLTLTISVSDFAKVFGSWGQIVIFIGGLMFALSGTAIVSRLIGADTGANDTLQQIMAISMVTRGVGSAVKSGVGLGMVAGKIAGSGAMTAGSAGIYGLGRKMGGQSIKQMGGLAGMVSGGIISNPGSHAQKLALAAIGSPMGAGMAAASKHIYSSSAKRVANNPVYKTAGKMNNAYKNANKGGI